MSRKSGKRADRVAAAAVCVLCAVELYLFLSDAAARGVGPGGTWGAVCLAAVRAVSIHLIKSLRLYLILLESRVRSSRYLAMYAETSAVNMILPYKAGELYRAFRIGRETGSQIQGLAVVLFDRFIDTLALLSVILTVFIFLDGPVSPLFIVLAAFCLLAVFLYCLFPTLYKYLNSFLVFNRCSPNTLRALGALGLCKKAYQGINSMARGRFLLLYLLSLTAWIVETGLLALTGSAGSGSIGGYLTDAMLGTPSSENIGYFLACFVLFAAVSAAARLRTRKEDVK